MNRKVKFLGCFFVLLALIVCNIAGNANAFPTHKECWYLGKYSYNQLCEKVKKGDWDDFKFHVWLTIKTIELVENYYGIQLPDELKQEIIIGSFEEDYDIQGTADCARYNAIGNEAVLTIIASIRCENHFYNYPGDEEGLTYGANEELNVSALAWALDSTCNNYDAKDGYNSGLSKKFFRSLGHVLHLLQDTGSPAHARNDNHALTKGEDYYETALENMTFENYTTKAVLPESPIIAGDTLQSFFDEMQKFTCRNFFSNDTMFANFHEGVNLPFDGIKSYGSATDPYIRNMMGQDGYIIAQYSPKSMQYVNGLPFPTNWKFPTTWEEAQILAKIGIIEMAGVDDFLKYATPKIVGLCAGMMKQYLESSFQYTFPDHSQEGWVCGHNTETWNGNDFNTWQVHVIGDNPGVESAELPFSLTASKVILRFSARVLGNSREKMGYIYLRDEYGSWDNPVEIDIIPIDQDYHEYTVDLGKADHPDLKFNKFSIELTDGGSGNNEYWAFDWVEIIFKDDSDGVQGALIGGSSSDDTASSTSNDSSESGATHLPYIYGRSVSCRSMDTQGNDYQPSNITSLFPANAGKAYVFTEVSNVRAKLSFRWEFYGNGKQTVAESEMASAPDEGKLFPSIKTYSWIGLIPKNSYTVKIYINAGGGYEKVDELNFSVERMAPQYAPMGVNADPQLSGAKIILTWNPVDGADNYIIHQAINDPEFRYHTDYTTGATQYDFDVDAGSKYFYRVRALNTAGESEWSETVEVDLVPRLEVDPSSHIGDVLILSWVEKGLGVYNRSNVPVEIISAVIDNTVFELRTYNRNDAINSYAISSDTFPLQILPRNINDINLIIRFKPQTAGTHTGIMRLETSAGSFEVALTGEGNDLKFWHTYDNSQIEYMCSITEYMNCQDKILQGFHSIAPNYDFKSPPQNPLIIEAADVDFDNHDRVWVIASDENGKPMLYQYSRFDGFISKWTYWPNDRVGRLDGISAVHHCGKDQMLWIAGYNNMGGSKSYKLMNGEFSEKKKDWLCDDENFKPAFDPIISIFSSSAGDVYVLTENSLQKRDKEDGAWTTIYTPDSFYEKSFTCGILQGDAIYLGSSRRAIVKIDADGEVVERYMALDKASYDENSRLYQDALNRKDNCENSASYYSAMAAQYDYWASSYEDYARRYSRYYWSYYYWTYANNYRRQASYYRNCANSYSTSISAYTANANNYYVELRKIDAFEEKIEAVKLDSAGRVWAAHKGNITAIENGNIIDAKTATLEYMRELLPNTPELLLRELERDGRFWNLESVINGKLKANKRKIIVGGEESLIILWAGDEFI